MKRSIVTFTLLNLLLASTFLTSCQPKPAVEEATETGPSDIVKLSAAAIQHNQIRSYKTTEQWVRRSLKTTGEIRTNADAVFQISSLVPGRVVADRVTLGDQVGAGETLALVENIEVAKINADLVRESHLNEIELQKVRTRLALANASLKREQQLYAEGISPQKDLLEAQTAVAIAKADMAGVHEHAVHIQSEAKALLGTYNAPYQGVNAEKVNANSRVNTPRSGVVTRKNVTLGQIVDPSQPLYEVTDLSKVWLDIVVYPKDVPLVKEGQAITFQTDSLPKTTFHGKITYLQPQANTNTQTFVARAYLNNLGLGLRPGMFGQVKVQSNIAQKQIFVPDSAIQTYGKESFVFKDLGSGRFQKKTVVVGSAVEGGHLIESGLNPGERIVSQGSFLLKAEMLKSLFQEEEE